MAVFFKEEKNKFYTSAYGKLTSMNNPELKKLILDYYNNFAFAYIPESYDIVLVLEKENINDSSEDVWHIGFYKKTMDLQFNGNTVTLDNIEDIESSSYKYEIYKSIDATYEDVLKISGDLMTKHVVE